MSSPRNATAEIGNRRSYEFRGVHYPSATTILKLGRPKEWLGAWAAKTVAEHAVSGILEHGGHEAMVEWLTADRELHEATKTHQTRHKNKCPYEPSAIGYLKAAPWRIRDQAADAGTERHETLEALAAGETLPDDAPGRVQLEQWRDGYRPDVIDSEAQVVNPDVGYAGSFDLLAKVYGRMTLIDLKTSKLHDGQGRRKNVDRDWSLQLAAYRHATYIFRDDQSWTMPPVDDCAVLWVPSDAPEQWMFLSVPANGEEFDAFLAAKRTHDDYTKYEKAGTPATLILPQAASVEEVALRPRLRVLTGG